MIYFGAEGTGAAYTKYWQGKAVFLRTDQYLGREL
jgi:hypothetical protein